MDINLYARNSRLPRKILLWMVRKEYIRNPLLEEDIIGLRLLEKVWWKSEVLRSQLMKYSRKDRKALIETADLPTRWERYAYSRFINLGPGEKLPMRKLVKEIEMTYDFTPDRFQMKRLYRVRQRVYNRRKQAGNIGKEQKQRKRNEVSLPGNFSDQ